ncbi:MAG: 2Fe-2S iron-sulfur cluster-binding protein [Deltaproteobacteria bacterium]|nr:2Fe-2S iron-sulfur cluster-binding protein [Deltaproteobacteria bacterium]
MAECNIKINGKPVTVSDGTNLIEAARKIGIEIPHFCYHRHLSVAANCRMCLVEIKNNPKLVPACQTKVAEGMEVFTDTDKVKRAQAAIMEFLFINHPVDCPICDQAGECYLQEYYMKFDKTLSRYKEEKVKKRKAFHIGPRVIYDAERCILCTRCIRFMGEIVGRPVLGIKYRGDKGYITTFKDRSFDDSYSVNTADICPVGALTSTDFRFKVRVWELSETESFCWGCSKNCSVKVCHKNNVVFRFLPRDNDNINRFYICDEGRLSYKLIHTDRLGNALRKGNRIETESALSFVSEIVVSDAQNISVVVSPSFGNETIYLIGRLVKDVLRHNNVYYVQTNQWDEDGILKRKIRDYNYYGFSKILSAMGVNISELKTDLQLRKNILLFGANMRDEYKDILSQKRLMIFDTHTDDFVRSADIAIPVATVYEEEGTVINSDGILQRYNKAIECQNPPLIYYLKNLLSELDDEYLFESADLVFNNFIGPLLGIDNVNFMSIPSQGLRL